MDNKKKVGVLTMHKVLNYGSALQAYATQRIIEELGYECELIDYIYPNKYHKGKYKYSLKNKLLTFFLNLYLKFPNRKKDKLFIKFYNQHFKLSNSTYFSPSQIFSNPPAYDIYVVGSDQVWNSKYILDDTTFLLSFVDNNKKISYASSFAQSELEKKYANKCVLYLSKFDAISVRELGAKKIIKDILKYDAPICLDPTLLLNKRRWDELICTNSTLNIGKPYILVYILKYAYNPYPYVTNLIKNIYKETGLHLVLLCFSFMEKLDIENITNLHDAVGPSEFIYLFKNAEFVITTSFHGTAFALNFEKPFYSIIDNTIQINSDDRIYSLLEQVGANERAIKLGCNVEKVDLFMDYSEISPKLDELRQESVNYLKNALG